MAWRYYSSADSGAPNTLNGTAGSLTGVLDLVLTGPSFNGTGFAYGSKPCAGWNRQFSGTNKSMYQSVPGPCYRIDDNAPDGNAAFARLDMWLTASSVDTGTERVGCRKPVGLPDDPAYYWCPKKSSSTDATIRAWRIVANDRTCLMLIQDGYGGTTRWNAFYFGAIKSRVANDQYNGLVACRTYNASHGNLIQPWRTLGQTSTFTVPVVVDQYYLRMFRDYNGAPDPIEPIILEGGLCTTTGVFHGPFNGVEPASQKIPLMPFEVVSNRTSMCVRGKIQGLYRPQYTIEFYADGDTFTIGGRTFMVVNAEDSGGGMTLAVEISDTVTP
jgi:hypothetical protein